MVVGHHKVPGTPVVDGVGWIRGWGNCFALREDEETFLIDVGLRAHAPRILRAFRASDVPLATVRNVLLTHHHADHRGGAAYFRAHTSARLACHSADIPFVEGREVSPMPWPLRTLIRAPPVAVGVALHDGDRVGPLHVIHTPGHTPGEVVFYHPERKLLFSGDAVVEEKGRLSLRTPRWISFRAGTLAARSERFETEVRSLARLQALDVGVLLPGHGEPLTSHFDSLLEDLLRNVPRDLLEASRS